MGRKGLTKKEILSRPVAGPEWVDVPEWDGGVYVREMTAAERDAWEATLFEGEGRDRQPSKRNVRARLAVEVVVNEDGSLVFDKADVEALGALGCAALDRIFDAACRKNRLLDRDLEDLAKNSGASPGGSSNID